MTMAVSKQIDWDYILASYGEETRNVLKELLNSNSVDDSDPAAIVIAGLFISQIDTNKAFQSIESVINQGKDELSEEFKNQILTLRGIIAYAEEHVVESGERAIEARRKDLLNVVKHGIAQAIGEQGRSIFIRSNVSIIAFGVLVASVAILSALSGAVVIQRLLPTSSHAQPVIGQTPELQAWMQLYESNRERIQVCLANTAELSRKCVVEVEP